MVGIFGGSFDPIHHAHLVVAQVVLERLGLQAIRFVPAGVQPFKAGRHAAPAPDRAAMVERAIAGHPRFVLDRIELERAGPSYTVDTLTALRARDPEIPLALLVGADAAADIGDWHRAAELPGLARIVVFGRPGASVPASPLVHEVVEVPALEISATEIRRRVRLGLSVRYWVPDAVAEYIATHRLYLDQHDQ